MACFSEGESLIGESKNLSDEPGCTVVQVLGFGELDSMTAID